MIRLMIYHTDLYVKQMIKLHLKTLDFVENLFKTKFPIIIEKNKNREISKKNDKRNRVRIIDWLVSYSFNFFSSFFFAVSKNVLLLLYEI